jgi:hypothetical protein
MADDGGRVFLGEFDDSFQVDAEPSGVSLK